MTGQPILINPAGDAERRLWQTTNEITVLLESIRWVLIGGQMLTIIEREHGGGIGRATVDVDALLDVRATVGAPRRAASLLRRAGFDAQPTTDGLVYPRDSWLGRVGSAFLNAQLRLAKCAPFRVYVHRAADVDAILAAHGLVKRLHRTTLIWQLGLFERPAA